MWSPSSEPVSNPRKQIGHVKRGRGGASAGTGSNAWRTTSQMSSLVEAQPNCRMSYDATGGCAGKFSPAPCRPDSVRLLIHAPALGRQNSSAAGRARSVYCSRGRLSNFYAAYLPSEPSRLRGARATRRLSAERNYVAARPARLVETRRVFLTHLLQRSEDGFRPKCCQ